ncbi:hypothetical protein bcgnr5372_64900 [Bacillus luti]|nr:replication initiation protein [Bacillus cereus]HDR8331300.1 replication initiation protein [Bacillus cereus]HDR8335832.1 replication initiation protein [Bacillus cereus]
MYKLDKKTTVRKSNALIEAMYQLTSVEQKVLLVVLSHLDKKDNELFVFKLPIKNYCEMLGIQSKNQYSRLKEVTENLMKQTVAIKDENNNYGHFAWVTYVRYLEGKGLIEIQVSPLLKPYLLNLKNDYTEYSLKNILNLKHSQSIRLYELLKQHEKNGTCYFHVDELIKKLGLGQTSYERHFGSFKKRVLEPAQAEIKTHTDIHFEFYETKTNKKVNTVSFNIFTKSSKPTGNFYGNEHSKPHSSAKEINTGSDRRNRAQANALYHYLKANGFNVPDALIFLLVEKGIDLDVVIDFIQLEIDNRSNSNI